MTEDAFFRGFTDDIFLKRIKSVQEGLYEASVDAFVIEDPIDLAYLTGHSLSLGQLWIAKEEILLLVDGRYIESAKKKPLIPSELASSKAITLFLDRNTVASVAFDGAKITFDRVDALKEISKDTTWTSYPLITKEQRIVKDKGEVYLLEKSAQLLFEGFLYIKSILREGISEKEVACQFTVFCLEKGAEKLAFDPIIAFGENSAMPHYRAGEARLKEGDIVLIDIGIVLKGYHSDMTRMVFFGPSDPFLYDWLKIVFKAHDAALNLCKPGVLVKELDKAARLVFKLEGVEEYFVHSLGHGVGLEIHESPKIRFEGCDSELVLRPGMVVTIEPGLYLPGKGGIRYEDTVVITDTGFLNFFPNKEIYEIS